MASSSSSFSPPMKYQVFLSFRGEDTRLNFTAHLLKALKDKGMSVFFDEEKLERGEHISPALSQAIAASRLSIIVLSSDYASSKSCLAELCDIMDRRSSHGHIVLPVFYHVDPSDVRNFGASFKTSFDDLESKRPVDEVKRWKADFAEVGKLKGWHIEGGKSERSETDYIKDIVEYVIKKLMNSYSTSASKELVGIDDQKNTILDLLKQQDSRVIGLWGMGGIGKTTLAGAVYNEASLEFEDGYFLQNVSEKIEKQGRESLRNELLSKLLNEKEIRIDTPSIGNPYKERLSNKKLILVLDDVTDSDQIDFMGVTNFGMGSKIIVTSRNRQVLSGGANQILEVNKLNKNDSFQLFSTFAFKLLNPPVDFRDMSSKFVEYAQGCPLALKVLGSKLYTKSRKEWESEVDRLKQYAEPKISQILKSSFDGLDELEKNIFLDIACFFKGGSKEDVERILSCSYKGAVSGISNLADKCLLDITNGFISMHDLLEEMGKDIVRQESKHPGNRTRLWIPKDVYQVLKYNQGTGLIEGIKLDMSQIDNLLLHPSIFENMFNLKYIHIYGRAHLLESRWNQNLHANGVDIVSLPNELRYLWWDFYPFKSLSSSFNPKNLVVLKLKKGNIEQLWNENDYQDVGNLRVIDVSFSMNLRKIPNLSRAINLKSLDCTCCRSLVEVSCLNNLASLETLNLYCCKKLRKIPNLSGAINLESLDCFGCESLVELPCLNNLASLETLKLSGCIKLRKIPNLLGAINLKNLDCSECESLVELPCLSDLTSLETIRLRDCKKLKKIPNLVGVINLKILNCCRCESLVELPCLSHLTSLETLQLSGCKKLKKIPNLLGVVNLKFLDCSKCESLVELPCLSYLTSLEELDLGGCRKLKMFPELPSNFESVRKLKVGCSSCLKSLPELPPYLCWLDAGGCRSLEKVSFTNHDLYQSDSLDDDDDDDKEVVLSFSNCSSLNQFSIKNIEANAMLQIESLAKRWERMEQRVGRDGLCQRKSLICCFPGYTISAKEFKHRSENSSLDLKIAPKERGESRSLAFAVCLVPDFSNCFPFQELFIYCKFLLTASSGEELISECVFLNRRRHHLIVKESHVFILFGEDMIVKDNGYKEASFDFRVIKYDKASSDFNTINYDNGYTSASAEKQVEVKRCGVHVFYLDA